MGYITNKPQKETSMANLQPNEIILKNVRISFPVLFQPQAYTPKGGAPGQPMYSAALLLPKNSPQAAEAIAAVKAAINAKFPGKADQLIASIRGNRNKYCVQDGDNSDYDGYQGNYEIRAKNKSRPTVLDRNKAPVSEADNMVYSGCYVNAKIAFFAYDSSGKGVSSQLIAVQFVKDGDAFGSSAKLNDDDFSDLGEGAQADSDNDPLA
jgi:hypothetical protein